MNALKLTIILSLIILMMTIGHAEELSTATKCNKSLTLPPDDYTVSMVNSILRAEQSGNRDILALGVDANKRKFTAFFQKSQILNHGRQFYFGLQEKTSMMDIETLFSDKNRGSVETVYLKFTKNAMFANQYRIYIGLSPEIVERKIDKIIELAKDSRASDGKLLIGEGFARSDRLSFGFGSEFLAIKFAKKIKSYFPDEVGIPAELTLPLDGKNGITSYTEEVKRYDMKSYEKSVTKNELKEIEPVALKKLNHFLDTKEKLRQTLSSDQLAFYKRKFLAVEIRTYLKYKSALTRSVMMDFYAEMDESGIDSFNSANDYMMSHGLDVYGLIIGARERVQKLYEKISFE